MSEEAQSGASAALARELRELEVLDAATAELDGESEIEAVLQAIVEHARGLIGAPYGALIVQEPDGSPRHFVHSGLPGDRARRIGDGPRGEGLLGLPLTEGLALRVEDARVDSRAYGVPEGHPELRAVLAVPVPCGAGARADLYLADDRPGRTYDERDERLLRRFALRAGLAVARSRQHRRRTDVEVAVERDRLAREIHDGTAQVLSYVTLTSQGIEGLMDDGRLTEARDRLRRMGAAARAALADLRAGIRALRHAADPDRPLSEALRTYADRWHEESGIELELRLDSAADGPPEVRLQLLRIVQEALANARKHGSPRRVCLEFGTVDGTIVAKVSNDGCGFDPARTATDGRYGLAMMQERARSVGGRLEFDSAPGSGTRIVARLPRCVAGSGGKP